MRKKSKIRYLLVIVIIGVITGFTCTFATAKEENPRKSTKLVFEGIEWLDPNAPPIPPPSIPFIEDGVLHIKYYWFSHLYSGTVGDEEVTGYTKSLFHLKQDLATGDMVLNGITWIYITWGDLTGYFAGTANCKIVSGVFSGKFTFQGFEGFEGMKAFGIFWSIDDKTNGISGTILIPN